MIAICLAESVEQGRVGRAGTTTSEPGRVLNLSQPSLFSNLVVTIFLLLIFCVRCLKCFGSAVRMELLVANDKTVHVLCE